MKTGIFMIVIKENLSSAIKTDRVLKVSERVEKHLNGA